ncbi:MAG: septum formation initiator family protein [Candidatus Methylomirabilaceae bacterium]
MGRQARVLTPVARDGEIALLRRGADRLWRFDLVPSLCLGGLVLLGVLFYVWQHIQVVRLGYEIEQLQGERVTLLRREKELRVDLARLKSLRRVEEIARRELGLTTPVSGQVMTIE